MALSSIAALVVCVGIILYVVVSHNRLVKLKHNLKAAWSNIDVLLRQHHDELPEIITTRREYTNFERATLEMIVQAHSQVSSALQSGDLNKPGAAESAMNSTLGQLFALTESSPELKANESFMRLQSRITILENSIADRRELYNDSVNANNVVVDAFPTNLVAWCFSFMRASLSKVSPHGLTDADFENLFA